MNGSPDWVFYHALYHLLTHFAAFMATLGLSVSIGVALASTSTTFTRAKRQYCLTVLLCVMLASWFFLWRMYTYSTIVNRMLPIAYFEQLSIRGLEAGVLMLIVGVIGTVGIACLAIRMLFPKS